MTRPVWLLDVDGVLNATRPSWGTAPFRAYAHAGGHEWRMTWAPKLIHRILELHRSGEVEIRWCSTWCNDAAEVERIMHLPKFPPAFVVPDGGYVGDLKLAAARAVLADDCRLIWTDDDETPTCGPIYDELTAGGRGLLIAPNPRRGLQPPDLDAIEEFLAAGRDRKPAVRVGAS